MQGDRVAKREGPLEELLGPLEQDVMDVVWQLGSSTVRDVHEQLARNRKIAYTTVMTTMSRLARKGLLQRNTSGLAHVYSPAISRERYARSTVGALLTWLLERYPEPAVSYLAEVVDEVDEVALDALRQAVLRRRKLER